MKLFKKAEKAEPVYTEVIERVHDEFNTAGEKLYQEALLIINSTKILNEEKTKRLIALGFKSTKEVTEAEDVMKKKKLNEEMVEIINYYRIKYPLNKFITKEQVEQICEKYGLIYSEVYNYIGFVPEENLNRIEAFKLDDEDVPLTRSFGGLFGLSLNEKMSRSETREYYEQKKREVDRREEALRDGDYAAMVQPQLQSYYRFSESRTLLIAAPAKGFKITNRHEVKNFKLFLKPVPDPVVLASVIGGYLIVTAWGDEASDPLVQNEINN
jgi:hypothetical protein